VAVLAGAVGREEAEYEVRAALNRAARKLNQAPPESWGNDPPVVYAVDLHLEHVDEYWRVAVSASRRREIG
jgi:hypothetical protein